MKTKTLKEIMDEGWAERPEQIGYGRKCVLYERGDMRMLYDEQTNSVIKEYRHEERKSA